MSKKSNVVMVKLIRGASFVTPGQKFLPGAAVPVTDPKLLEVLKRSQQFKITEGDEVDDDEPEASADPESGEPTPAPKKRKKRK
ncbi:hypothetical protein LCGC14_0929230 [marine sediment metagenome]|uniref:Uncharacterized protein n=1 Tax=marine sediment metagenome TaxID=412755 RepID=A0A0F9RV12_9ZZZZ